MGINERRIRMNDLSEMHKLFAITLEESIARWEHIKANWKYHFMKCVKPKRKLRRRKK